MRIGEIFSCGGRYGDYDDDRHGHNDHGRRYYNRDHYGDHHGDRDGYHGHRRRYGGLLRLDIL